MFLVRLDRSFDFLLHSLWLNYVDLLTVFFFHLIFKRFLETQGLWFFPKFELATSS